MRGGDGDAVSREARVIMITVDDATEVLNRFSLDRITSVKLKDSFGRFLWSISVALTCVEIVGVTLSSLRLRDSATFSLNQRNAKTRGCKVAKNGKPQLFGIF